MSCSGDRCPYKAQREITERLVKLDPDAVRQFSTSAQGVISPTEAMARGLVSEAYDRLIEQYPDICKEPIVSPSRDKPGIFCPAEQIARQALVTAGATLHQRDISNTGQYL